MRQGSCCYVCPCPAFLDYAVLTMTSRKHTPGQQIFMPLLCHFKLTQKSTSCIIQTCITSHHSCNLILAETPTDTPLTNIFVNPQGGLVDNTSLQTLQFCWSVEKSLACSSQEITFRKCLWDPGWAAFGYLPLCAAKIDCSKLLHPTHCLSGGHLMYFSCSLSSK